MMDELALAGVAGVAVGRLAIVNGDNESEDPDLA
jgi:hypothetical protein